MIRKRSVIVLAWVFLGLVACGSPTIPDEPPAFAGNVVEPIYGRPTASNPATMSISSTPETDSVFVRFLITTRTDFVIVRSDGSIADGAFEDLSGGTRVDVWIADIERRSGVPVYTATNIAVHR